VANRPLFCVVVLAYAFWAIFARDAIAYFVLRKNARDQAAVWRKMIGMKFGRVIYRMFLYHLTND